MEYITPDPRFTIISKTEAARICGISTRELDRRRKNDPECPKGFKEGKSQQSLVKFRQQDIFDYVDVLIKRAKAAG
ncbi:hypothetical protein LMG33818_002492 [Halomonadaceae bacterium LMG 33818]|uniref:hypothetical protein n=1 Tax=Cernens ardua TaxID=3402176 RepID=UPI003EDC6421